MVLCVILVQFCCSSNGINVRELLMGTPFSIWIINACWAIHIPSFSFDRKGEKIEGEWKSTCESGMMSVWF